MLNFLVTLLLATEPELARMQAHEDSMYIYNAYKGSIAFLKQTNDPHKWYQLEDSLGTITACSFRRLQIYNNKLYKPLVIFDKKGYGTAPYYPAPSEVAANAPQTSTNTTALTLYRTTAYSVISKQTRFLTNGKGSVTPYVERVYFDYESNIIKTVKLNPVTHLPLKSKEQELLLSSN